MMTLAASAAIPGQDSSGAAGVRLLLGGRTTRIPGFTNVDLYEGSEVDIRRDVSDLSCFASGSVRELYASHILEHFPHVKTLSVLKEWQRVLERGGKAYISVPDLDAMLKIYAKYGLCDYVRNTLWGDQGYDLAYHYTGFTYPVLASLCVKAGFSDVKRLAQMPYGVDDCSHNVDTEWKMPVSINIEAIR